MTIPEFMPILSAGKHESPAEGACIMEYVSFLAGEAWTDFPKCTSPVLAHAAQYVNDDLKDEARQRLLPLLPRLMGAAVHTHDVDWAIAEAAADYVQHLVTHENGIVRDLARDAQVEFSRGFKTAYVTSSAELALVRAGEDTVAFLSALIDAYDEATGRTAPATVTEDDLRRCAELTGATR